MDSSAIKSEQSDGAVASTSSGSTGVWGAATDQEATRKDKRIDKVHTDTVLNYLLRLACKVFTYIFI